MPIENIEVDDYDPLSPSVSVVAYTGGEEAGAVGLGVGYGVFKEKAGSTFRFRTLQAGEGVSITEGENELLFSFDASDLPLDEIEFGSTDNLAEGNNNLYFTNTRVRQAISIAADSNPALVYRQSVGEISLVGEIYGQADFNTDFAEKTTADLAEAPGATVDNGQMYFTNARARNALTVSGDLSWDSVNGILHYTGYKTANFDTDFSNKSTTDLAEGSNLYYTQARVASYLTTNNYLTQGAADNLYIPVSHPSFGITAQNIIDWNALAAATTLPWSNITSKPGWITGSGATAGQMLVWTGATWEIQTVSIPTDLQQLTDNTDILGALETPDWDDIQGKPVSFAPSAHTHNINDITNLQLALDGKAAATHTHPIADITGLQTELDSKLDAETTTTLAFNPALATLTYTDETGTPTVLDLSTFNDDTNLAYIVSGVYDGNTELITFTRSDASEFSINVAALSQIKTLEALTDTDVSGAQADGTVLTWNDTAQKWEPVVPAYFDGEYSSLNNVPTEFNPAAHTHALTDITDGVDTLDILLDDKSDVFHAHLAEDITDFAAAVAGTVPAVGEVVIDGGTF